MTQRACKDCIWATDTNQNRMVCHLYAPGVVHQTAREAAGDMGRWTVSPYSFAHDKYGRPLMEGGDFCGEFKRRPKAKPAPKKRRAA